jgi:hypothetical protein
MNHAVPAPVAVGHPSACREILSRSLPDVCEFGDARPTGRGSARAIANFDDISEADLGSRWDVEDSAVALFVGSTATIDSDRARAPVADLCLGYAPLQEHFIDARTDHVVTARHVNDLSEKPGSSGHRCDGSWTETGQASTSGNDRGEREKEEHLTRHGMHPHWSPRRFHPIPPLSLANPAKPIAPNTTIRPKEGSGAGSMPAFHGAASFGRPHGGRS